MRRQQVGRYGLELLPRSAYSASYCCETAIIGFSFDSQVGVHAFGSDRKKAFRSKANGLAFVPNGCDVFSQSELGGEYLKITFTSEGHGEVVSDQRFSDAIDAGAIVAARRLRSMLMVGGVLDALELEKWINVLRCAALRLGFDGQINCTGHQMTTGRLRQIDELIERELSGALTVQTLADKLGLSLGYFSRAFKRSIGQSPYDYIIDRRIMRARTLLQQGSDDLSAIALASGFTSHSHLTNTFRSRLGIAPSQLRASFK